MEADIEFFPRAKKAEGSYLQETSQSPQRRVCLERFASARTFTAACSAARLGSGRVFYTTMGN